MVPRLLLISSLYLSLLHCHMAHGAEMLYIELWKENDTYKLRSASLIDAPPELIFKTLVDYDHFYRLSHGIKETRFLKPDPDGTPIAETIIESCVLFFCKKITKTERVIINNDRTIQLSADPQRSDFKYLSSSWTVSKHGKQTRLAFDMDMIPDFWIPPLIGEWAIKRKLYTSAMNMARRMEYMAATDTPLSEFSIK